MADNQNFKHLEVWMRAMELTKLVYSICESLPDDEKFGLCSQMKRAAVSIPSNIAEGYRRNNPKEFLHFLGIASGSCAELETQLILVNEIFQVDTLQLQNELIELQKMLSGLSKSVRLRLSSA